MKTYKTKCGKFIREQAFVVHICEGSFCYMGNRYKATYCGHMRECRDCKKYIFENEKLIFCELEETTEKFDYKNSVNKTISDYNKSFYKQRMGIDKGEHCPNIRQDYGEAIKEYDLEKCIKANCLYKTCCITGKQRTKHDLQLVNIFYDIKHTWNKGFLEFNRWEKNLKYFRKRVARDLAIKQSELIRLNEPEKLNLRIQVRKTEDEQETFETGINLEIVG